MGVDTEASEAAPTEPPPEPEPCPEHMVLVGDSCMDRYEAPNVAGADPLVMFTFVEAASWCAARDKRLCFDDEWVAACAGSSGLAYPYGNTHQPGVCNDDETWRTYSQSKLSGWPYGLALDGLETLNAVLDAARDSGASGREAADHVASLYQGEGSGENSECVGEAGVFDLVGNVEEWTRRRSGGSTDFHGNLKGRYWSEARTCQSNVTTHGDHFRFYEIGFRCCRDANRSRITP